MGLVSISNFTATVLQTWLQIRCIFCVTCCKQRWHLGITSPSSVRPSVRPSVRLSVCLSACHTFRHIFSSPGTKVLLGVWLRRALLCVVRRQQLLQRFSSPKLPSQFLPKGVSHSGPWEIFSWYFAGRKHNYEKWVTADIILFQIVNKGPKWSSL